MFGFVGYIVHANGIHWPWKGPWESIPTDVSPQVCGPLRSSLRVGLLRAARLTPRSRRAPCATAGDVGPDARGGQVADHPDHWLPGVLVRRAALAPSREAAVSLRRTTAAARLASGPARAPAKRRRRENAYVLKADGEAHYMRGGKPGYFPTFDNLPHPAPFNLYDPFKLSKNASPEKKAKGLLTEVNNGRLAMCAATEHTTLRRALASPVPPVARPRPGVPHLRVESMRPAAPTPAPEPLFSSPVLAPMRSPCMELISARAPLAPPQDWPLRLPG